MSETFVKNMLILSVILLVAGLIQKILIEPKSYIEYKPRNVDNKIYTVNEGGFVGCKQESNFDKLNKITGDREAYKALFYSYISTGECVQFKQYDKFYLDESGFALVKIRPKGKTESYWTNREILY